MALLYKSDPSRGPTWKALFAEHAPDIEVRLWPDVGDPSEIRYLAAWLPPENLAEFSNLEVIYALSAGVDQFDLSELPAHVPVVRVLDPGIAQGIVEYASLAVLSLHRQVPLYLRQQHQHEWTAHALTPASERRIGLMGLGNLGKAVLQHLGAYGFQRLGWARSAHHIEGVDCYAGQAQLTAFLSQCDILLCLLPLTDETRGILNADLFAALPSGASVINLGRGAQVVDADLLTALNSGHLDQAVIDVLEQEPPSEEHPFWDHPKIWLTPHIGAMTFPQSAFGALLDNIRRHQRGEAMTGVIERLRGY